MKQAKLGMKARRFEQLESKAMLAGDVTVAVVAGSLSITGDAEANKIAITSGETPGSYVIEGLDGTVVHLAGQPSTPPAEGEPSRVEVTGIRRDVRIALGEGDDVVRVNDANIRSDLLIATGGGADRVLVGVADETQPAPSLSEGSAPDVRVGGTLRITTGEGDDTVRVVHASASSLVVISDGGADLVRLGLEEPASDSDGDAEAAVSAENYVLNVRNVLSITLGEGDDTASLRGVRAQTLNVGGGLGSDRVVLDDARITGPAWIHTGEGDDEVVVRGSHLGQAAIFTAEGADNLRIVDSVFGLLGVALGAGDDQLFIEGVSARIAGLLGGEGTDTLTEGANNNLKRRFVSGFEPAVQA